MALSWDNLPPSTTSVRRGGRLKTTYFTFGERSGGVCIIINFRLKFTVPSTGRRYGLQAHMQCSYGRIIMARPIAPIGRAVAPLRSY